MASSADKEESFARLDSEDNVDALEQELLDPADPRGMFYGQRDAKIEEIYQGFKGLPKSKRSFCVGLGVALHDYSHRMLGRGDFRQKYREVIQEEMGISIDKMKSLKQMRAYLASHPPKKLDFGKIDIQSLEFAQIEQIFNCAFNEQLPLPRGMKWKGDEKSARENLLDVFKAGVDEDKIDISFLHEHQPLHIEIKPGNRLTCPLAAERIRRAARDLSKESQLLGRKLTQTALLTKAGSTMPPVAINFTIRPSGNIQLEELVGEGQYVDEAADINRHAGNILHMMQSGEFDPAEALGAQDRNKVFGLMCVVGIAEPIRSKAAVLTTAMFLDMVQARQKSGGIETNIREFPMSPKGAVDAARSVNTDFAKYIGNPRRMDQQPGDSSEKAKTMLESEGTLLASWAKEKGSPELYNVILAMRCS